MRRVNERKGEGSWAGGGKGKYLEYIHARGGRIPMIFREAPIGLRPTEQAGWGEVRKGKKKKKKLKKKKNKNLAARGVQPTLGDVPHVATVLLPPPPVTPPLQRSRQSSRNSLPHGGCRQMTETGSCPRGKRGGGGAPE